MANEKTEFLRLLADAPMAWRSDSLTVVGALSRTSDASRFMLTLPTGRSEEIEVDAVKSAKRIAGAIGQALVELELDAKRVPEEMLKVYSNGSSNKFLGDGGFGWGVGGTYHGPGTGIPDVATATGIESRAASAPFVVVAPHQAHHNPHEPHPQSRTYVNGFEYNSDHIIKTPVS